MVDRSSAVRATQTVLVIGAAGMKAGLVVPALASRGVKVRGLVRREDQKAAVLAAGATEATVGDLRDPRSLAAAMEGADGVFYMAPAFQADEVDLGKNVVAVAISSKIRRIVFSSVIHPMITALTNHCAKLPIEEAIVESGLEYAILQPAMFFRTLNPFWPDVVRNGVFAEPWSASSRLSRVDFRDIAEVVARVLTSDQYINGTYQLASPGWWDRNEIAALMTDVLNRPITAATADPWKAVTSMGSSEQRDGRLRMFAWYDAHDSLGNSSVLAALLGRQPRTLRAYLEELRDTR